MHTFDITYGTNQDSVAWVFDNQPGATICHLNEGEQIQFSFTPTIAMAGTSMQDAALIVGPLEGTNKPPFEQGSNINLKKNNGVVTAANGPQGLWNFFIAFSVLLPGGQSAIFHIPDPEVQVGSIP